MNKKIFLAGLLAVCLCLTLCACGGSQPPAEETPSTTTEAPTTTTTTTAAPTKPTAADGEVLYTIKVVDKDGNPVEGVYVQLCKDTCVFAPTDAEGAAYFSKPEDEYKVAFTEAPDTYYYFEDGSCEITLTYDLTANAETNVATEATEAEDGNLYNDVELTW